MLFQPTSIADVLLIDPEPRRDERGFFARLYCEEEFEDQGLERTVAQASMAFNVRRGTIRGLHFQRPPHAESKTVRCTRGAMFAVAVDLRPGSPTYRQHVSTELTADNRRSIHIPAGCAAGYQTLADDTEVMYLISSRYVPGSEAGVHHADPSIGIEWPLPVTLISPRDAGLPLLDHDT